MGNIPDTEYTFPSSSITEETNKNIGVIATALKDNVPFKIKAMKLELGSVSTLAQDTAPNYQQELAKCQRYFQRIKRGSTYTNSIGFGFASSETLARIFIPLPVEMRATPTATISSLSHYRVVGNGGVQTPSAISVTSKETNGVNVNCTGTSLTTNQIYNLNDSGDETSYIDLSADLWEN